MSTVTQPPPAAALLAEARARLAGKDYFASLCPAEQQAVVESEARGLALFRSPIGKLAVEIRDVAVHLGNLVEAFLDDYPDGEAAAAATLAAITGAGLFPDDPSPEFEYDFKPNYFRWTPEELRGWGFVLSVMVDRLDECDSPLVAAAEGGGP